MTYVQHHIKHLIPLGVILLCLPFLHASDYRMVVDLQGSWKFSIGQDIEWLQPGYNDTEWQQLKAPSNWESQGFYGYNGYGTYRKKFKMPNIPNTGSFHIYLGYIDDVDETYINGHKIGATGSFPPQYSSAYDARRMYNIPTKYLNFNGSNIITIKVYDSYQAGGIVSGKIGIYQNPYALTPIIQLEGIWKFKTGDNLSYSAKNYNDAAWDELVVPAKWEDQGYRDYDGYAWYRKSFIYRGSLNDNKIILLLGKIDDMDEVYVNGVKIGSTGHFTNKGVTGTPYDQYLARRGYYLDESLLLEGQKNTIAVRVYDGRNAGGIYEGPIGFTTQKKYIEYWHTRKKRQNQ